MTYPPGKTVVLVVEDEALVRMDAVDMMEEFGFDVLEASNSDEAIRLLEGRLDISVIFTDINMPGSMNGLKLAQAVRGRWPPIKIIVTSGRFKIVEGDLPNGGSFLPKPYTRSQFNRTFQEVTGRQ
jgi:CheY-like chemotaxis protein